MGNIRRPVLTYFDTFCRYTLSNYTLIYHYIRPINIVSRKIYIRELLNMSNGYKY